jgi:hypothetical protein
MESHDELRPYLFVAIRSVLKPDKLAHVPARR